MKMRTVLKLSLILLAFVAPAASHRVAAQGGNQLYGVRIEITRPSIPPFLAASIVQMPHVDLPRPELPKGPANKPKFHDLILTLPAGAVSGFQQWFAETQAGTAQKADVHLIGITEGGVLYPLLHLRGCIPTLIDVARPANGDFGDRVAIAFESIVYDVPTK